ncbi:MAG: hypothetical protein WA461_01015, partial [Nitrososphaeraceae archaeon]
MIAFDTMKPITAPITITGNRSVCPPISPSKRDIVKGIGKTAHARAAIPTVTATPSGMNVRPLEIARPNVPPMKSNGNIGPPSNPVAKDVLVRSALSTTITSKSYMDNFQQLSLTRVQSQWKKRPDEAYDHTTYDRSA